MGVLDTAITMEIEGERFYRDLADSATSTGFKKIFTMLADDEVKHKNSFEELKKTGDSPSDTYEIASTSHDFYRSIKKEEFSQESDQVEVYRKALDLEKKSVAYYKKQMDNVDCDISKTLLAKIIEEEQTHLELLASLVEYIEVPDKWVESAEFGARNEY